jgi:hypothetical protein
VACTSTLGERHLIQVGPGVVVQAHGTEGREGTSGLRLGGLTPKVRTGSDSEMLTFQGALKSPPLPY